MSVEVIEQSEVKVIEAHIETALVKENLTEKVLAEMEKEYLPLKIKNFEDKEGYELVRAGRLKVKAIRVLAVKCTKKGRESAQAEVKAWIAKEKEIVARIEKVETYLEAQEESYEAERERIKAEKKQAQDAALIVRSNLLLSMGAAFNGVEYSLEDVVFSLELIREADESIWLDVMLPKYKAIFDRNEAVRLQKEADEKAEKERVEKERETLLQQQKELEEQQQKLKDQQDEIDRQKKQMAVARYNERCLILEGLGLTFFQSKEKFEFGEEVEISVSQISEYDNALWEELVGQVTACVNSHKEKKAAAEQRFAARSNQLIEIGMNQTPNGFEYKTLFIYLHAVELADDINWNNLIGYTVEGIYYLKETERLEQEKREQEIRTKTLEEERERQRIQIENENERLRLEEVKRKEEAEQMNDTQRWTAFVKDLQGISIPQCKSGKYRKLATIAAEKLEEITSLK